MKTSISFAGFVLTAGAISCLSICTVSAAETNAPVIETSVAQPAVVTTSASTVEATTTVKLPYGVEDVLKLSRANISEDIVLNYIQNSGTIYNLAPQDIVYLRNQGVSDHVVNAMLNQRKQVEGAAQIAQQFSVPNAPAVPDANMVPVAPTYLDPTAAYAEPQPAPTASSVYVIPYPQASAAYYGYYGYYGPYGCYRPYYYGGYCGPSVSLGFGFGGRGFYGHGFSHGHGGRGWHR